MKASLWLLVPLLLCTGTKAEKAPILVSLWFHRESGPERVALEASVKRFNAANKSLNIQSVRLSGGSYTDLVSAAAYAKKLPCLLDLDGPNLYNLVWNRKIISLEKYIDPTTRRDFLPSIIQQGTYNKKLYSLGQYDSGLALWGNRTLLERARIRIPRTLEGTWSGAEFEAALAALKKSGLRYPLDMKLNYGQGEWFTYGFSPIMQSFGGDLIRRTGKKISTGILNSKASVRGMTYFQRLVRNYVNVNAHEDTEFTSGKAALSYVGNWVYPEYKKALGKNLVLIPMPKFGTRAVTASGSWNYGISATCPHPDAAAKVLNFLLSTDEVLAQSQASGAIPSRYSAIARSTLYNPGQPLRLYVEQLNHIALSRPATPAYPAITKAFAQAVSNIVAGGSVKKELDQAARAVDWDIADNGGYPLR